MEGIAEVVDHPIFLVKNRLIRWSRDHPRMVDGAVAVVLFALAMASIRLVQTSLVEMDRNVAAIRPSAEAAVKQGGAFRADAQKALDLINLRPKRLPMLWIYLFGALATLPLALRRVRPNPAHIVVFAAFLATVYFSPYDAQIVQIAGWLSTYSFAAYATNGSRYRNVILGATAISTVLIVSGVVRNRSFYPDPVSFRESVFVVCLVATLYLSSIAFGIVMRRHRDTTVALAAHVKRLDEQQLELARTVVLDERVRIARELHDVVAHHVSVMGMQAGAARLRLGGADSHVSEALSSIEQSSREAVADLYRLLGFLRSDGSPVGDEQDTHDVHSPQPSLDSLPQLLQEHSNAGYKVVVATEGATEGLPSTTSLTAYRIIQEALTNIRKHASNVESASVLLRATTDSLRIEIVNSLSVEQREHRGGSAIASSLNTSTGPVGLGIRGMTERATLLGGRLVASVSGASFRVEADLPLRLRTPS